MKNHFALAILAVALAACNPAPGTKEAHDGMTMSKAVPFVEVKSGTGTGVVKSVDAKGGKITLEHQPMPELGWPAMTMSFPVNDPALLDGIEAGQTVSFDVTLSDNRPMITGIRK